MFVVVVVVVVAAAAVAWQFVGEQFCQLKNW